MICIAPDIDIGMLTTFTNAYFASPDETLIPTDFIPDESQNVTFVGHHQDLKNLLIVKCMDESIVGFLHVTAVKRTGLDHTGDLGMGLLPEYTRKGYGSELMAHAIKWFHEISALEKLELLVLANNPVGQHLYRKHGFYDEGHRRCFYRNGSGHYIDAYEMALLKSQN